MSTAAPRPILQICDDQSDVREALRLLLKGGGYAVETYPGPAELLVALRQQPGDVLILDMNYTRDTTSGEEGLALIRQVRESGFRGAILAMTAWGDISLAVAAMQSGASDFLEKPWNNDKLLQVVAKWSLAPKAALKEFEAARIVQQGLLRQRLEGQHGFSFACRFLPARNVSGDYYDFFELPAGQFGFVVADVSGKGMPAAILMANLQGLFRSHAPRLGQEPALLLSAVNRLFHESTPPEAFASAFYAVYEEARRELTYLNCGHPAAFVHCPAHPPAELAAQAMVLGVFPAWHGEASRVVLPAGARLLAVSDGAIEAQRGEEEFGEARLWQCLERTATLDVPDAMEAIESAIRKHSGADLFDDCTLLLMGV
ncbi:MAG: hypothetical protein OHK0021_05380 [Bryobacter sp.]